MKPLLAAVLWSLPALAMACPACARDSSPWGQALVGAMIVLPFAVASVVIGVVRRGDPGAGR